MARKRKTVPSQSPDKDESSSMPENTAPARPIVHLRRSNRRLAKGSDDQEDKTREIQGKIMGYHPEDCSNDEEAEEMRKDQKEGVQLAIEGLARMERRLQRATKRQKQKVEESNIHVSPEFQEDENPFHPQVLGEPAPKIQETLTKEHLNEGLEPLKCEMGGDQKLEKTTGGVRLPETNEDVADVPPERGAARPPPVNSSFLPLPWTGRLGYACLNTYLRTAKPPVFSSRTCRMASILDHRYPLEDESQPEHHLKNRPDKGKEPSVGLGMKFVQELGLANARDIVKMLRWNDKYGIRLFRLSSEMFPFASHPEHGYKLAPFASEVLAEAGTVAAELGHRLTTHPGQYTQLASPRKEVIDASIRDLEYHDEMLSLLRLPEQQNRDAVMILHMGGVYGDKAATLDRFRHNYQTRLSPSIKARLVLENDDVAWCVHDLLPVCEELNIPLVLDYHHHNIIFDKRFCREGTYDISQPEIMERIAATWKRKGMTQKMHYSEPCAGAVTPRDRRKHSPRVMTLPPCPPNMDLMIEAKDKEQAVFELMRTFKLPGFERINDVIPYEREDEDRPALQKGAASAANGRKSKGKSGNGKRKRGAAQQDGDAPGGKETVDASENQGPQGDGMGDEVQEGPKPEGGKTVKDEDFAMGGPMNRVYWPLGKEEWLRPMKRGAKVGKVNDEDDLYD